MSHDEVLFLLIYLLTKKKESTLISYQKFFENRFRIKRRGEKVAHVKKGAYFWIVRIFLLVAL